MSAPEGARGVPDNVLRRLFSRKPVAYYPELAECLGSVAAAIFLQEVCHWERWAEDGWVFRKQEEIKEDTALSVRVQQTAREHLVRLDVLEERHKGIPSRLYYRVKHLNLEAVLQSYETAKQDSTKAPNKNGQKRQSINTGNDAGNDTVSPKGGKAAEVPKPENIAKHYTTLTVDRTREVGFEATGRQIGSWGKGFGKFVTVPEGETPPDPELVHRVIAKIVEGATRTKKRPGYFVSVKQAREQLDGYGVPSGQGGTAPAAAISGEDATEKRVKDAGGIYGRGAEIDDIDDREASLSRLGSALSGVAQSEGPEGVEKAAAMVRQDMAKWPGLERKDVERLAAHFAEDPDDV